VSYDTVKGKSVALGAIVLSADLEGNISIKIGDQRMELTEGEASALYELMGDVMSWKSSDNVSDNALGR